MPTAEEVAAWFKSQRGIEAPTLAHFGVGISGNNVTFPYSNGVKERPDPTRPLSEGQRRFYFTKGVLPTLFQELPFVPSGKTAFLVEGETDTMRLWQETEGAYAVFGLSGINTWRAELAEDLRPYERVYVVLDNDDDYMVKSQVDNVWTQIRNDLGGASKRITLPPDVKDLCEFFDRYDVAHLDLLAQRMSASRFKPVDFTATPPPVEWLLEGWVAKGDVTVLAGKGGLGKSWITMGLTLAMLTGEAKFLEEEVTPSAGRILYVDQENPLDVVHDRMKRLGLDPAQHSGALRYLWNQGIRLDKNPDRLLDEAMDFKPDLIVLDSLTRLHSKEENVAGDIAPLFNDGIQPLARKTGAAVVLIHHHDKGGNGARGSTDIVNSADAVIDIFDRGTSNPGKFLMRSTKTRRKLGGTEKTVQITDLPGGGVELHTNQTINPIF